MSRRRESLDWVLTLPDVGAPITSLLDAIERDEKGADDHDREAAELRDRALSTRKQLLRGLRAFYSEAQIEAARADAQATEPEASAS